MCEGNYSDHINRKRRTQMPFEAFILLAIIMIMLPVAYDELFKGGE
jgi:hypothetical protein